MHENHSGKCNIFVSKSQCNEWPKEHKNKLLNKIMTSWLTFVLTCKQKRDRYMPVFLTQVFLWHERSKPVNLYICIWTQKNPSNWRTAHKNLSTTKKIANHFVFLHSIGQQFRYFQGSFRTIPMLPNSGISCNRGGLVQAQACKTGEHFTGLHWGTYNKYHGAAMLANCPGMGYDTTTLSIEDADGKGQNKWSC